MHRALHILLMLAVLWCGLHVSPAEADETIGQTATLSITHEAIDHEPEGDRPESDGPESEGARDHGHANVPHGCHSHCPIATDLNLAPALALGTRGPALLFTSPATPLTSASQAPPIEPPAA